MNHPGTLLKNVSPKIAPKNQESEFARKKVQNLLKKKPNKMANQTSYIMCRESSNQVQTSQSPQKRLSIVDADETMSI